MAGHSKWANTKHKKARNDSLRQKLWGKFLKEITVAAKLGGGDVDQNPRLRAAVAKAKSNSLPIRNIDSAIQKGIGGGALDNAEELVYEGYGVEGTAFIVQALSDNKARTAGDVRLIFSKYGGQLGELGSVSWGFKKQGQIAIDTSLISEEECFEIVADFDGEDLVIHEDCFEILCSPEAFGRILNALEQKGIEPLNAEVSYRSGNRIEVNADSAKILQKMIEKFEDLDDVQEISHNIDYSCLDLEES